MPQDNQDRLEKVIKPSDNDAFKGDPGRNWTIPAPAPTQDENGSGSSQQPSTGGSETNSTSQNEA